MLKVKHLSSLHIPHHKTTAALPVVDMPSPSSVNISLSQNIGAPCQPLVKIGDTVHIGTKIGDSEAFLIVPVHASISGTVRKITSQRNAAGSYETLITIESDNADTWDPALSPPIINSADDFIGAIRNSGLVGLGGAAFPTWLKANPGKPIDTLVINAAECEPYITSDHRTLLDNSEDLINGILAFTKWLEIPNVCLAIEDNKKDAINLYHKLIKDNHLTNFRVMAMKASYPKGAERVLVYELTGKHCPTGVLPADYGLIISNVSTVAFIGRYLKDGHPLVTRNITVDGDAITAPQNVRVPIGTAIKDVAAFCGGYTCPPGKILMGGPMMGRAVYSDTMPVIKSNNALLFFSKEAATLPAETACIHCGRCHEACPFDLYPMMLSEAYQKKDTVRLSDLQVMQCMECGSCSYICPAHRPLSFTNKLGKILVKEAANHGNH